MAKKHLFKDGDRVRLKKDSEIYQETYYKSFRNLSAIFYYLPDSDTMGYEGMLIYDEAHKYLHDCEWYKNSMGPVPLAPAQRGLWVKQEDVELDGPFTDGLENWI